MKKISVIVCTYNRCRTLEKALRDIAKQSLPGSVEWEVLIVDNNSSDQTREIAEQFCHQYPGRFRYVFESQPGQTFARNAGIREAKGDILVFTDDDIAAEPTWVQNLTAPLQEGPWAGAGGRILPEWPCTPPKWLPRRSQYSLSAIVVFDLGDKPGEMTETPYGANMAYRKEVFEKYGGFRTDLGHRGTKTMGHDDSELGHRLLDAGERIYYAPSAVVLHPVTPERLQKKYFLRHKFDMGRGDIRHLGIPKGPKCCGVPLFLFRRLAVWTLRWMTAFQTHRRFEAKLNVWGLCGQIAECYSLQQAPQPQASENLATQ
jgi:glycosyltransferase involved in cell wall biosynthesis